MTDLSTLYAGLKLRNPIIVGSSGLTTSPEKNKAFEEAGAGAIVLKSLFEEQIEMQSDVLMDVSDSPEASAYIQSYVKANHVEEYLQLIRQTKAVCTIPVIASINCYDADTWIQFARHIQDAGADALELNVFYLCTDLNEEPNDIFDRYMSIVQRVKKKISIPVIMKISRQFSNIPGFVNRLRVNGASAVVLFNRFYQPDIDIERMAVTSGHVFSSPGELAETLRWTAIVSARVRGISIASSTGVHDWQSVLKCVLAGASAVQLCTALYQNGPAVITQMLAELTSWMEKSPYSTLTELQGRLNAASQGDTTMYERSQFMKYYSNRV